MQAVKSGYMHRLKNQKYVQLNNRVFPFKMSKSRKIHIKFTEKLGHFNPVLFPGYCSSISLSKPLKKEKE